MVHAKKRPDTLTKFISICLGNNTSRKVTQHASVSNVVDV